MCSVLGLKIFGMKRIIFAILILSLLVPLAVFAQQQPQAACPKGETKIKHEAPNFCEAGHPKCMRVLKYGKQEDCAANWSECHDARKEEDHWVYDCVCQGSNPRGDCHVGGLISDPICACCGDCTLYNALELGTNIAQIILKYLGVIALALFVLGGIMWLTSGGAQQKIETGKKIIVGALIGLVIVLAAFLIVQFVLKRLAPGYEMEEESRRPWLICTNSATDSDNLIDVSNYFRLNSFVYS